MLHHGWKHTMRQIADLTSHLSKRRQCRGFIARRRLCVPCAAALSIIAAALMLLTLRPIGHSVAQLSALAERWLGLSYCKNMTTPPDVPWVEAMARFSCAKLFAGDVAEQRTVRSFLRWTPRPQPCYRDCYLSQAPCSDLRAAFRNSFEFTDDEQDFPLAYGLRVHTCATQVELLLRSIYAPHNVYCLHVDGRSPPHFIAAMRRLAQCLPNVLLAPIDEDFVYASASQMDADHKCMRVVRDSPVRWRYFINLAGQELPLKTNDELVRMLRSLNGSSHVYLEPPANTDRQTHSWWCKNRRTNRTVNCARLHRAKDPPPNHVTIRKSCANAEFSRAFVDYVLDERSFARRLYDWLSDTLAPEEHYYATLLSLPDTPGGVWSAMRTRATIWLGEGQCSGFFVRDICVMETNDLPRLAGRPEPFVNKFNFEADPVAVRCLVERVVERELFVRMRLGTLRQ